MLSIGICDDSQDNRQSLRWLLESILEGKNIEHTIFEFSSGETLLQWDQKHPNEIDLLFLDIEMGSVNGMETASQLRENTVHCKSCLSLDFQIMCLTAIMWGH